MSILINLFKPYALRLSGSFFPSFSVPIFDLSVNGDYDLSKVLSGLRSSNLSFLNTFLMLYCKSFMDVESIMMLLPHSVSMVVLDFDSIPLKMFSYLPSGLKSIRIYSRFLSSDDSKAYCLSLRSNFPSLTDIDIRIR